LYCDNREKQNWSDLSHADIRNHLGVRHRQGLSGKSLQRELSAIRSFFNYLCKVEVLALNPANGLRAPKAGRKLPTTIDVDQISGLLDQTTDDLLEIRDLAMFELFYSSGLRLSELVALNLIDIDVEVGSLRVRSGKGKKSRDLPVGKKAIEALQRWFDVRQSLAKASEPAVFISTRGGRLGNRSVQLRLQRWCQKIGLPEHVHPHMLRHSFASHMLESSRDLRAVQELLGHSNISTTQIYTHLDFQHLADIYDQTHPRAKK
jgi:integrase/recombinase XerC